MLFLRVFLFFNKLLQGRLKVLYNDGRLENRKNGEVLLDDVGYMMQNGDFYILQNQQDGGYRIADGSLKILREYTDCWIYGEQWLVVEQDGKMGVYGLDGTERIPCDYDKIRGCNAPGVDLCIAQKGKQFPWRTVLCGMSVRYRMEPRKWRLSMLMMM